MEGFLGGAKKTTSQVEIFNIIQIVVSESCTVPSNPLYWAVIINVI